MRHFVLAALLFAGLGMLSGCCSDPCNPNPCDTGCEPNPCGDTCAPPCAAPCPSPCAPGGYPGGYMAPPAGTYMAPPAATYSAPAPVGPPPAAGGQMSCGKACGGA
jgi:hypothetical protein